MNSPMKQFLDNLISEATESDGVAQVQIIFHPGTGQSAGGLRKTAVEGLYELCTFCAPGNIAPEMLRQEDLITASMFFEANAVQRVMQQTDQASIEVASPSIVMPGAQ